MEIVWRRSPTAGGYPVSVAEVPGGFLVLVQEGAIGRWAALSFVPVAPATPARPADALATVPPVDAAQAPAASPWTRLRRWAGRVLLRAGRWLLGRTDAAAGAPHGGRRRALSSHPPAIVFGGAEQTAAFAAAVRDQQAANAEANPLQEG
jgi:hypothetical protein